MTNFHPSMSWDWRRVQVDGDLCYFGDNNINGPQQWGSGGSLGDYNFNSLSWVKYLPVWEDTDEYGNGAYKLAKVNEWTSGKITKQGVPIGRSVQADDIFFTAKVFVINRGANSINIAFNNQLFINIEETGSWIQTYTTFRAGWGGSYFNLEIKADGDYPESYIIDDIRLFSEGHFLPPIARVSGITAEEVNLLNGKFKADFEISNLSSSGDFQVRFFFEDFASGLYFPMTDLETYNNTGSYTSQEFSLTTEFTNWLNASGSTYATSSLRVLSSTVKVSGSTKINEVHINEIDEFFLDSSEFVY